MECLGRDLHVREDAHSLLLNRYNTFCCNVKSSRVSLGTLTWSPLVMISDPAPAAPPTPAPMAAPLPLPAMAPIIEPTGVPPILRFASLCSPLGICR